MQASHSQRAPSYPGAPSRLSALRFCLSCLPRVCSRTLTPPHLRFPVALLLGPLSAGPVKGLSLATAASLASACFRLVSRCRLFCRLTTPLPHCLFDGRSSSSFLLVLLSSHVLVHRRFSSLIPLPSSSLPLRVVFVLFLVLHPRRLLLVRVVCPSPRPLLLVVYPCSFPLRRPPPSSSSSFFPSGPRAPLASPPPACPSRPFSSPFVCLVCDFFFPPPSGGGGPRLALLLSAPPSRAAAGRCTCRSGVAVACVTLMVVCATRLQLCRRRGFLRSCRWCRALARTRARRVYS